jgi:hypothetical protein
VYSGLIRFLVVNNYFQKKQNQKYNISIFDLFSLSRSSHFVIPVVEYHIYYIYMYLCIYLYVYISKNKKEKKRTKH